MVAANLDVAAAIDDLRHTAGTGHAEDVHEVMTAPDDNPETARHDQIVDRGQRYAIVGAGPSGLAAARAFARNGVLYDQFERASDVGGVWNIDSPWSTMYETAHLISSKRSTEFHDFPFPDDAADYPHYSTVRQYFRDFAEEFGLYEGIEFETEVERVERLPGDESRWIVTLDDGERRSYEGLVVANGHLHEPNWPAVPGELDGRVMHSAEYVRPEIFDERRVLVVGAGNSGCDIAVDAVPRAEQVYLSMRRGYHIVPKYILGIPAADFGAGSSALRLPAPVKQTLDSWFLKKISLDPQQYGVPEPDHDLYESHPVVNSQLLYHLGHDKIDVKDDLEHLDGDAIVFSDGSREAVDLVVYATGYRMTFPFLDDRHFPWDEGAPDLWMNIFHPDYDDLFVIGLIESDGGGFQIRDWQGEMVARFIRARQREAPEADEFAERKAGEQPDTSGGFDYEKPIYVNNYEYKKQVRRALEFFE